MVVVHYFWPLSLFSQVLFRYQIMNEFNLLVPVLLSVPLQFGAVGAIVISLMDTTWLSGGIVTSQGLWQKCYKDRNMCFFLPAHG